MRIRSYGSFSHMDTFTYSFTSTQSFVNIVLNEDAGDGLGIVLPPTAHLSSRKNGSSINSQGNSQESDVENPPSEMDRRSIRSGRSTYSSKTFGFKSPTFNELEKLLEYRAQTPPLRDRCEFGVFYWLNLRHARDWGCLFVASVLYACAV